MHIASMYHLVILGMGIGLFSIAFAVPISNVNAVEPRTTRSSLRLRGLPYFHPSTPRDPSPSPLRNPSPSSPRTSPSPVGEPAIQNPLPTIRLGIPIRLEDQHLGLRPAFPSHLLYISFVPGVDSPSDELRDATAIGLELAGGYLIWHYPQAESWRLLITLQNFYDLERSAEDLPPDHALFETVRLVKFKVKDNNIGTHCHLSCIGIVDYDRRVPPANHQLIHGTLLPVEANEANEANWEHLKTEHNRLRPPAPHGLITPNVHGIMQ